MKYLIILLLVVELLDEYITILLLVVLLSVMVDLQVAGFGSGVGCYCYVFDVILVYVVGVILCNVGIIGVAGSVGVCGLSW